MAASGESADGDGTHRGSEGVECIGCGGARVGGYAIWEIGFGRFETAVDEVGGDEDGEEEEDARDGDAGDGEVGEFAGFDGAWGGYGGAFGGVIE